MTSIIYNPPPTIREFVKFFRPGELFYDWIVGPFGCVAGSTPILTEDGPTPIADIDRPTRVLSWNATTCRFQLSWCGGAFPKGRDCLYRVTTPGGVFDAAGHHLMLCADGEYRRVEDLRPGDVVGAYSRDQHPTSEELSRSVSPLDAQHYPRTVVDSLGRYATSARLHGRRFLAEEDNAPAYAPSQDGARVCAGCSSQVVAGRAGGLAELTHKRSRPRLPGDPRQMRRCDALSEITSEDAEGRDATVFFSHVEGSGRASRRSPQSCATHPQEMPPGGQSQPTFQCEASTTDSLRTTNRPILSIERLDVKQPFWDMQVSDTNNYVTADGCIHHNSGKTTGLFFKLVHMASLQAPGPDGVRRSRAVVVRNTAPQLNDTTLSSWFYWFKPGQAGTWEATKKNFTLRFGDVECEVMFRPLDTPQDIARVLSLEVTFAIIDEFVEIPRQIIDALSGRVGRYPSAIMGGATNWGMWGSSNPSTEDNWWYDYLHNKGKDECLPAVTGEYFLQPPGLLDDGTGNPAAENVENLPGKEDYYVNQAKGKSDAWINQFLKAQWGYSVSGKPVVPTFRSELHTAHKHLHFNEHLPLIGSFDPGVVGSAMVFGQEDLDGRLLCLGELVQQGYGASRFISDRLKPYLRRRFPLLDPQNFIVVPDPAAANRTASDERSVVEIFQKHYRVSIEKNNRLPLRLDAIEHFTTRLVDGRPALQIDAEECPNLIRALKGGWRYKLDKNELVQGSEPEKNQHSHVGDGFGYLCRYYHKAALKQERYVSSAPRVPAMAGFGARCYHAR